MTESTKEGVLELVLRVVGEMNSQFDEKVDLSLGGAAPLFGSDAPLDSLNLVSLVVALEEAIQDELGVAVTIADERVIAQSKSPFATIQGLTDYVVFLLESAAA